MRSPGLAEAHGARLATLDQGIPGAFVILLEGVIEKDHVVLIPKSPPQPRFRQGTNKMTGLPVLELARGAPPVLTSEQVAELLVDFP